MLPNANSLDTNPGRDPLRPTLANQRCRFVIAYFRNAAKDHASIDEIVAVLARRDNVDETQITTRLHHVALPKLDDVGIVDYDVQTNTVRYHGHSHIEQLKDTLPDTGYRGRSNP